MSLGAGVKQRYIVKWRKNFLLHSGKIFCAEGKIWNMVLYITSREGPKGLPHLKSLYMWGKKRKKKRKSTKSKFCSCLQRLIKLTSLKMHFSLVNTLVCTKVDVCKSYSAQRKQKHTSDGMVKGGFLGSPYYVHKRVFLFYFYF